MTTPRGSLWSRWKALIAHREPAYGLALFRMGMGVVVLWELLSMLRHGLVPVLWLHVDHGGYRTYTETGAWLIDALGGPSPTLIWTLLALGIGASTTLVAGIAARLSAFLALQCMLALAWTNAHAGGSYDPLITNLLWLLVLADSGSTGGVSARLRSGQWWPRTPVPAWPRYLVVGQLVALYASTGLQKVSASWVPGGDLSALYYILQQPSWQRTDMQWVAWIYPVTQAATLATWLFEVGAPVLILAFWYRHTHDRPGRLRAFFNRIDVRTWWLAGGAAMHLGIMATMDVGTFSLVCLATYACAFHADELTKVAHRLAKRPPPLQPSPSSTADRPEG